MVVFTIHPPSYSYSKPTVVTFVIASEESIIEDTVFFMEGTKVISTEVAFVFPPDDVIKEEYNEYDIACYCVTYLREVKGLNIRGDADTIVANIGYPVVGGVVLFNYNGDHHASFISAILPNGNMILHEANKDRCQINVDRVVRQDDEFIRGYYFTNPNAIERR